VHTSSKRENLHTLHTTHLDSLSTMSPRFICSFLTLCLLARDVLLPVVVAQSGITRSTATLSEARAWLAATSSGDLVFFGGGWNGTEIEGLSSRVDICNVRRGSWTTSKLSVPRYWLAATSSGNLVIFAGGGDEIPAYNQVDIYNLADARWRTATLSQARFGLAATSVRNLVLFGGGHNGTWNSVAGIFNVVDVYNVRSNKWTTATLSQARCFLAATSAANRYALFAGGYEFGASNTVDIFDSLSGVWNTATLSQARYNLAAASLGNLAFFGGGNRGELFGGETFNAVDIFNATTQTWSTATLSQNRTLLAAASIGDIVAFGGGTFDDGPGFSAVVDMYNATSKIWFTASLNQPRGFLAATSSTNKIFFGGGISSRGVSNLVDIFDIPPSFQPTTTHKLNESASIGVHSS